MRLNNKKKIVRRIAMPSATTTAYQTPSMPKKIGMISTAAPSKSSVLRNEISADVSPSLSAVKKPEPNIETHINRNDIPYTASAWVVILSRSAS